MRLIACLTSALTLVLASCGHVSRNVLLPETGRGRFTESGEKVLPVASIPVGEKTLAYKSRVGFPPMFGGYFPTLMVGDESVAKVDYVNRSRGSDTYLTGLQPGETLVYVVNAAGKPRQDELDPRSASYRLRVLAQPLD
ncbi:MAG: pilus assembly protein N-terminal domain-containing protein [Verrucomicrobiota bacterium JB023]|nr:pilus assembly protein N-terminal domain-containing protein [Verrucomicrobiota bacterium JB023]